MTLPVVCEWQVPRWVFVSEHRLARVPTPQGKLGKWQQQKSLSGKTLEIWKYCQNTGNLVCWSCKFPDPPLVFFWRIWITQFCVCNSHKSRKLAQGKFTVGQRKHREFENAIWVGTLDIRLTGWASTVGSCHWQAGLGVKYRMGGKGNLMRKERSHLIFWGGGGVWCKQLWHLCFDYWSNLLVSYSVHFTMLILYALNFFFFFFALLYRYIICIGKGLSLAVNSGLQVR